MSSLGDDIARVFGAVLAICDAQGLIGRELFAIDGVKLPSNASKRRSGTRVDFERQATKLEAAAQQMLVRHRVTDAKPVLPVAPARSVKEAQRIARLEKDAAQIRDWLVRHPTERRGPKGTMRQSNRTDNESAKMATGKGVIQGYTGVAAVDGQGADHRHGAGARHRIRARGIAACGARDAGNAGAPDRADADHSGRGVSQ